ncbi:MAG: hypothetical protein SCALA701_16140 [Candidatus Scalindua sp.]|nr:MAG: hypothetical protein SCALA701_16140 [Candidatus Scalindua sp.]
MEQLSNLCLWEEVTGVVMYGAYLFMCGDKREAQSIQGNSAKLFQGREEDMGRFSTRYYFGFPEICRPNKV